MEGLLLNKNLEEFILYHMVDISGQNTFEWLSGISLSQLYQLKDFVDWEIRIQELKKAE